MSDDLVLHPQQIGAGGLNFGPQVSADVGVDELGVDPHLVQLGYTRRSST